MAVTPDASTRLKRALAGASNPDTSTRILEIDLRFPAFVAAIDDGDAVFHTDGHLALGRAAEGFGISQMVLVAASRHWKMSPKHPLQLPSR